MVITTSDADDDMPTGSEQKRVKEHFPNKCILVFVNNIWWINHAIKVLQIF
jgi:hypothetical protein